MTNINDNENIEFGSHAIKIKINKKKAVKAINKTTTKWVITILLMGMLIGAGILALIIAFLPL